MANKYYARSTARENQRVRFWRSREWVSFRTPQSRGAVDVIAMKLGEIIFEQIKTGGKTPFDGFGPAARQRLLAEGALAGAQVQLTWYPLNARAPEIFTPDQWPPTS